MKAPCILLSFAVLPVMVARLGAQAIPAKELYDSNCKKCHGVIGTPPKAMKEKFPKIATFDAAFIAKHTADSIVTILTKGKGEDMKSFKGKLTPAEMAAIAGYVHDLATRPRP
jgi:mono/diheme cytochrome c family protein